MNYECKVLAFKFVQCSQFQLVPLSVVRMLLSPQCKRNIFLLLAGGKGVGRVEVETAPFALYYREINFF